MNQFPDAEPIEPLYEIDGVIYKRIPAKLALHLPAAIRAAVEIKSGEDKGGKKICWFVRLPNTQPVEDAGTT